MTRTMRLTDEITPGRRVAPSDLHQLRSTLSQIGLFDPATDQVVTESRMTPSMERALRALQASQGLRPDAVLRPNGPTETRLNRMLEEGRSLGPLPSLQRNGEAVPFTSDIPTGRVGPGLENHPEDVAAIGRSLQQQGHIKPLAPQPLKTGTVFDGLKSFQTANGLVRDGIAAPNGPTAVALAGRRTGATPKINREVDPESDAAVSEAERLDAARFLDRLILSRRGERIDRSADDAGLAFRERQFQNLTPEDQEREIARLRQVAAPPESGQLAQELEETKANRRVHQEEARAAEAEEVGDIFVADGRRKARLVLNRSVQIDRSEPPSSVAAEYDPDDDNKDLQFLVGRYQQRDADSRRDLRDVLEIASDPNHPELNRLLDLGKRAIAGDGAAKAQLGRDFKEILDKAGHVDSDLSEPFLVGTILENFKRLDPQGDGPGLAAGAQIGNVTITEQAPSPDFLKHLFRGMFPGGAFRQ